MGCAGNSENSLLSSLEILLKEKRDKRKSVSRLQMNNIRCRRIVMKRRARLDRSIIRPRNSTERKVRTLKKLVPNCESMGFEGLFRETADYIMALQMRVKVMQIMVDVLSGSNDDQ